MKKLFLPLLLLCSLVPAQAAVQTIQVTIGASATQVSASSLNCKWVVFQDNTAADSMRIGDANVSTTRGVKLVAGASFFIPTKPEPGAINLQNFYVAGTNGDVLDVVCDTVTY